LPTNYHMDIQKKSTVLFLSFFCQFCINEFEQYRPNLHNKMYRVFKEQVTNQKYIQIKLT
ncbi:hypothetical protein ABHZ39_17625, partial [Bacteroides uniformis]